MSDEKVLEELRRVKRSMEIAILILAAMTFLVVLLAGLVAALLFTSKPGGEAVSIEANPAATFSNEIQTARESDEVKERAARKGYFTKSEFSKLMGFSVRTLERRIEEGRLDPPPEVDRSGVRIDLETVILAESRQ